MAYRQVYADEFTHFIQVLAQKSFIFCPRNFARNRMPSIGVLEHFQKPTDKPSRRIKKAGGHSLVNRGMAFWLRENILLQMLNPQAMSRFGQDLQTLPVERYIPETSGPSQSPRMGRLKWEPPKSKRTQKGHPWQHFGVIDQSPVLSEQVRFRHV